MLRRFIFGQAYQQAIKKNIQTQQIKQDIQAVKSHKHKRRFITFNNPSIHTPSGKPTLNRAQNLLVYRRNLIKLKAHEQAVLAKQKRLFNHRLFLYTSRLISPKIQYVKKEIRLLSRSRIFQGMLCLPLIYVGLHFYWFL